MVVLIVKWTMKKAQEAVTQDHSSHARMERRLGMEEAGVGDGGWNLAHHSSWGLDH